ncbi:TonB-dependent receptor [Salinisphaera sp. PC39]|uniref:TonB-dependent receptor family protein n=1 Tax=Salinisphaera sp. PC39 TaxID=1304156 RepID=UPI00334285EF
MLEVIGSKEAVETLPGSGSYLDTDDLRDQSYDDVNRALRKVPGVYIREEDGYGLFPNISLRGVDPGRSAKVMILEDGVPQAPAPYSAPSAYYSPTAGRMRGLEVLKGSSQVRHGPHITGGVINYLSTEIPGNEAGYFKLLYGDDDELRTHAWYGDTVTTGAGRVGFLAEGFFRRTDGFKHIDGTPDFRDTDETGLENDDFNLKFSWEPDSGVYQRFELKLGRTDIDADETYLGLTDRDFRTDPYRRYSASRFDNIATQQDRVALSHFIALSDATDLSTVIYNNEFERNWFKLASVNGNNLSRALAEGGNDLAVLKGEAAGQFTNRNNSREYYSRGIHSLLSHRFATGGAEHELSVGLRVHGDQIDRFQQDEVFTQEANGTISDRQVQPEGAAGDRIQETLAVAVNVDDRIRMGRLTITPGIRFERLDLEYEQDQRRSDGGGSPDSGEDDLDLLGGGIGATWRQNANWSFFGGVFRGFSPPGPRAAIRSDLKEETSLSTEAGVRFSNDARSLRSEVTVFRTDFDDLVVVDNVGASAGGSGETTSVGEVVSQGVELSLAWDPSIARGWAVSTPLFVSATYTDAEIANASTSGDAESIFSGGDDGNEVPYIPDYQFTVGAALEAARWKVDLTGTYVDSSFASASNTSRQVDPSGNPDARFGRIDSFFVVDASAKYRLDNGWRLLAGAHNLLDREYMASRLPHGPRPGKPRFVYMGLEADFN